MDKVLLTGSTGFLGSHLKREFSKKYPESILISPTRSEYDLMDRSAVSKMFRDINPDVVIHLAAYSGGIGANKKFPADFYYINTLLTTNVFDEAAKSKVKKLIYTMGGCSYPAVSSSPIDENQMWNGYPQKESAGYSMAKKMGIVASRSYRDQYGLNSVILIPGNMYGEFDNFRLDESHVVPAMFRRFFEAKQNNLGKISMWGTGAPVRDFVYAGDVAQNILFFIENYDLSEPVNISSGTSTSIKDLADTIKNVVGFDGVIDWDTSKPDGQMIKVFSINKLSTLGLKCDTTLEQGLQKTYKWFLKNYNNTGAIRL
jgi:GDP-L-fucose synthase